MLRACVQALGGMQREPGLLQDPRLTRMLGKWGVYDQDTLVSMFKSAGVGPAQ